MDTVHSPTWGTMTSQLGPFRLEELLGAGGMGEVWRAVDTEHDDRPVAVKVLRPGLAESAEFAERFRREASTAAALQHPNVVPVLRYGDVDGRLYLAMQLVDGEDLSTVLARDGALDPARAVRVVGQVADVLDAAHARGLLHRDVKPSNVRLVGPRDFVYLLDFGIARPVDGAGGLTATGQVVGTAAYMAPERFGAGPVDHRADVYSLAALLHSCLTGAAPFDTGDLAQAAWAHHTLPPPQPSLTHAPHLAPFDAVVAHGMAKAPADRPDTAGALAAEAARALSGTDRGGHPPAPGPDRPTTPPTTRPTPPPATSRWSGETGGSGAGRGRRPLLVGAAVAVLAVLAVAALLVGRTGDRVRSTVSPASPTAGAPAGGPGAPAATAAPAVPAPPATPPAPVTPAPLAVGAVARVGTGADPFPDAVSPDGRAVYVGDENGASVTVVDATTNRAVATVPTGRSPSALAVSPDGGTLWVAVDDGLEAVDTTSNTVRGTLPLEGVPVGVVASPDGRRVEVLLTLTATVVEVDAATLAVGRSTGTPPGPGALAASPDGATLAVASTDEPRLALLGPTGSSTGVELPFVPFLPRFSPDGRTVLVPDARGESLAVVDVATGRVTTTVATGGPVADVAFSPDGRRAYAHADGGSDGRQGTLLTLDTATWAITARTPVRASNSAGLALSPDGSRAYVVDQDAAALLVVGLR